MVPLIVLILEVFVFGAYLSIIVATLPQVDMHVRSYLIVGAVLSIICYLMSLMWYNFQSIYIYYYNHRAGLGCDSCCLFPEVRWPWFLPCFDFDPEGSARRSALLACDVRAGVGQYFGRRCRVWHLRGVGFIPQEGRAIAVVISEGAAVSV